MNLLNNTYSDDFPLQDEVEDFSGTIRSFVITCHVGGLGYTVRAVEEGTDGFGYEFSAYSETSPYSALGRLRKNMHRALSTRHITRSDGYTNMLHDSLRGRITVDDTGDPILVVDGIPLDMDELAFILQGLEGWEFKLTIIDTPDPCG